jgi:PIF1-like helicase
MDFDVQPDVFLTNESDVLSVIREFSLNKEQICAFRIICNHAVEIYPTEEPQLLMGVFGEGGTGKSRLIEAVHVWFRQNNWENELIVTATTGSAAVKINGSTVHSAVCIPIEMSDGK